MKEYNVIHKASGRRFLLRVETSADHRDYRKYEKLRNEIWDEPQDHLSGTRNMFCENYFNLGSCLYLGCFVEEPGLEFPQDEDHLVGFTFGFVGVKDKTIGYRSTDNFFFYAQFTGVREPFQAYGLGVALKDFQRKILLEVFGIKTVTCTYDPLTGVNAYRNIHHYGMDVLEYHEAYYGDFGGRLNRKDVPCDRFYVVWDLEKKVQHPERNLSRLLDAGHLVVGSEPLRIPAKTGPLTVPVAKILRSDLDEEVLLVEIPYDFYSLLKATDVQDPEIRKIPMDWRNRTRTALRSLLVRGYKVEDFRSMRDGTRMRDFYILTGRGSE